MENHQISIGLFTGSVEISSDGVSNVVSKPTIPSSAGSDIEVAYDHNMELDTLDGQSVISGIDSYSIKASQAAAGRIESLLSNVLPRKDRRKQTDRAYYYLDTDDLLQDLMNTMVDFTTGGLNLQATPPLNSEGDLEDESAAFQERLQELHVSLDIDKLVDDLARDWYVSDNMVLYWRMVPDGGNDDLSSDQSTPQNNLFGIRGLQEIAVLNPGILDWNNSLGGDILSIEIPKVVKDRINAAFGMGIRDKTDEEKIRKGLNEEGIGDKWIDAVRDRKNMVELRAEDGDYWIIRTKARKNNGLSAPSMRSIFLDLEARGMMKDGEFSSAYMMKYFIMLIQAGESIQQGPLAGQRTNWLKSKESKKLLEYFSVVARAMRAVVNHTINIKFLYPPPEMFNQEKFKSPEERIFNWSGISKVMTSGQGSDYGGGYLSLRKTISKMQKCRRQIYLMFRAFFAHPSIINSIETPKGFSVATNFDVNVLKEPRQLLEEVKWLFESGISDPRTCAQELGRDPERLKASKVQCKKENADDQVWEPVVAVSEPSIGGPENPPGRPANPGTERTEGTRTRSPGGRRTEND